MINEDDTDYVSFAFDLKLFQIDLLCFKCSYC